MQEDTRPSSEKQRTYGYALEAQLGFDHVEWHKMSMRDAWSRINMLKTLKELETPVEAPTVESSLDDLI